MSVIKAIFFARFHHAKGPTVLHQVPEGAIVTCPSDAVNAHEPLFDFQTVSGLVIPSQEFCDKLITVCINHCRIISYPVCVESPRYHRNEFIFNFALVLDEDEDFSGYTTIVRKLAHLFRNLEEQTNFLSREEDAKSMEPPSAFNLDDMDTIVSKSLSRQNYSAGGKIYALCEMMFEDLNHYCECMIPIDSSNTINLKVFPTRPPPAPIYPWHVPLATVQLSTLAGTSSDLTLQRVIPFIDGISSVAQIAQLADTDPRLTRSAIAHLLYYSCILLLDIFQFSSVYAPTAEIHSFVLDTAAQREAIRYIAVGQYRRLTEAETNTPGEHWAWKSDETGLDGAKLVELYLSLRQGVPLKNWCIEHHTLLMGIDIRRFITFGVIKGFLYRVHKYAVLDGPQAGNEAALVRVVDELAIEQHERIESWRDSGSGNTKEAVGDRSRRASVATSPVTKSLPLARYLDGMHCFDEICTELQAGEREVSERMKAIYKNVLFISR